MMYTLLPLGDRAIIIRFGDQINEQTHKLIINIVCYLENNQIAGIVEYVPAYCSITLHFHPMKVIEGLKRQRTLWQALQSIRHSPSLILEYFIEEKLASYEEQEKTKTELEYRVVDIPVCYGEEYGPDLEAVALYHQISVTDVIAIHAKELYLVHMLGFAPGFPYLGGMNTAIATPRKSIPRAVIAEGSVGIAGEQTGIYPISTPGGWQIIGRTPIKLFDPKQEVPSVIRAGDRIRFIPITKKQFVEMKASH